MMRIAHNIPAIEANRFLAVNAINLQRVMERLASGFRINRAADDAAGLAISEGMRAQISGENVSIRNNLDLLSRNQVAEGALEEVSAMTRRIQELSTQASNGMYNPENLAHIQREIDALLGEINRISEATTFNGQQVIANINTETLGLTDVNVTTPVTVSHTGTGRAMYTGGGTPSDGTGYIIEITRGGTLQEAMYRISADGGATFGPEQAFGPEGRVALPNGAEVVFSQNPNISDPQLNFVAGDRYTTGVTQRGSGAEEAIARAQTAVERVSDRRAELGAESNRLEHRIRSERSTVVNLQASESRIRDTEFSTEIVNLSLFNILRQSNLAMLAQANLNNQSVLNLFGGFGR
ncbi:MAG: flagellin N-terminal helical domain-containing protein [bacterium]